MIFLYAHILFFALYHSPSDLTKPRIRVPLVQRKQTASSTSITTITPDVSNGIANRIAATNNTFTPVIVKSMSSGGIVTSQQQPLIDDATTKQQQQHKNAYNLGRLDGLVSTPSSRSSKIRVTDSKKITAILLETNIVELQRHLLTITVQNQVC